MKVAGIYQIVAPDGGVYVGSSNADAARSNGNFGGSKWSYV